MELTNVHVLLVTGPGYYQLMEQQGWVGENVFIP